MEISPKISYKGSFNDNCVICFESLQQGTCLMFKPCGHILHQTCGNDLITCCLCRQRIQQKIKYFDTSKLWILKETLKYELLFICPLSFRVKWLEPYFFLVS